VTGTARSGSTLLAYVLSAHPQVRVASDPCFPLLRGLRDAILAAALPRESPLLRYLGGPLLDYYFTDERVQVMDLVLGGSLDLTCPADRWPELKAAVVERSRHESPDLAPHLAALEPTTYLDVFARVLAAVAEARGGREARYVGIKEVWMIDFLPALARAFPDARFVVLLRDPRATVASLVALAERDSTQQAHVVSYLRHWRKQVALVSHFQTQPLLAGRIHVLEYETLAGSRQAAAEGLCRFLELEPHADMLDGERYLDAATGRPWRGNSSFEGPRPKSILPPTLLELADFLTAPERRLTAYASPASAPTPARLLSACAECERPGMSWRSDLQDPQQDVGFELFRPALLDASPNTWDASLVRRSFLFEDVYRRLLERGPS
jgi:hypothetical protein